MFKVLFLYNKIECKYCKSTFKNNSTLIMHQKRAKYCLNIRNEENNSNFICICFRTYTYKENLEYHQKKCKVDEIEMLKHRINKISEEKDKQIEKLENTIKDLQNKLENVAIYAVSRQTIVEIEQVIDTPEELKDESYELVPLELDNGYIIESRDEDGYINITNLCKAGGKEFKAWNRLDKTKAFLKALSTAVGISTTVLIHVGTGSKFGTTEETTGTWVHPQVAINIAQWISPQFDVKVSAWVLEVMMTGKVDITNTKRYRELQQDNKNKQLKIQLMTKKYVKKQPRAQYEEKNVIYILTTANMKKERRYILGKATNLTSRLSVYNKSDEHEVVYYQECLDEERMSIVESLVFCKLKEYREQANRERFLLPEIGKVDFFINTIKECIKFLKEERPI
jgi:hypothetical protein